MNHRQRLGIANDLVHEILKSVIGFLFFLSFGVYFIESLTTPEFPEIPTHLVLAFGAMILILLWDIRDNLKEQTKQEDS